MHAHIAACACSDRMQRWFTINGTIETLPCTASSILWTSAVLAYAILTSGPHSYNGSPLFLIHQSPSECQLLQFDQRPSTSLILVISCKAISWLQRVHWHQWHPALAPPWTSVIAKIQTRLSSCPPLLLRPLQAQAQASSSRWVMGKWQSGLSERHWGSMRIKTAKRKAWSWLKGLKSSFKLMV